MAPPVRTLSLNDVTNRARWRRKATQARALAALLSHAGYEPNGDGMIAAASDHERLAELLAEDRM
jgi:hypothetical protein